MNINVLMFKNMFGDQKIYIPRGESSVLTNFFKKIIAQI